MSSRCESSRGVLPWIAILFFAFWLQQGFCAFGQAGNTFVNNTTAVPVPGVGHDYLQDLNEIVNPASGSVSVRIEAPRPKERGFNYPFYAFMYDSTQQFTVSINQQDSGQQYKCGIDSAGDNVDATAPTQPLNCVQAVTFPYESLFYPSGALGILPGPNSMLSQWGYYGRWTQQGSTYSTCQLGQGFAYEDPYGVIHDLGVYTINQGKSSNNGDCGYLGISDGAVGGDEQYKVVVQEPASGISLNAMIDNHGNFVQVPAPAGVVSSLSMEDTNGNAINGTGRSGSYQSFQPWGDALAKTASRTFAGGNTYTYTWGTATTQFSPSSRDVSISTINGQAQTLCAAPTLITGTGNPNTNPVVVKMQVPDGLYYTFSYDPTYGLLNKVTYPTGAWVQYTWGVNSLSDATGWSTPAADVNYYNDPVMYPSGANAQNTQCMFEHDTPAIVKRVVSYDGVHAAEEQDFSYSTVWRSGSSGLWSSKQTIVTTKDLLSVGTPSFKTIYNYIPWPSYHSVGSHLISSPLALENTIVYQDTSGNVLRTVTKVWNSSLQLAGECTTLPNGKISGVFYQYQQYPMPAGLDTGATASASTTNLNSDVAEYDYGSVTTSCQKPSTTPTRETVTTYASFSNTPLWPLLTYYNGNGTSSFYMPPIPDRPATIIVYQNGTRVSETDYAYDQTAVASVSPTPVGHDETNYGNGSSVPRGNPTTITRKCFQGSTTCTDSVTNIAYDATGQPVSVTDGNGNTTQLSYADNYTTDDGSPSGNTNTYLTKITKPSTNGVSHIKTFQWDFNKGQLRTLTDENQQQTSYQYVDPWWRLTQASFPDGGSITKTYQDAGPSPSVTTSTLITASTTLNSKTVLDAAGHVVQSQLTSDPEGTDYVDTVYDGFGRVYSVSNPYRTISDQTYGLTINGYDSLNRKTIQIQPDGNSLQWCYDNVASSGQTNCSGNTSSQTNASWVDFSDEAGNHWQRTLDALDRVTAVLEPNGTTKTPSMETDYTYDGLDNLLTVNQKGSAPTDSTQWRTRTFTYDSVSRLLTANNPESGTVSYTYDNNGNVATKTAPAPNQTGTATVTTTYTHDVLNRLTGKSYSDSYSPNPPTAAVNYIYDGNAPSSCPAIYTYGGPATQLGIGRLTAICDGSGTKNFMFDKMGRIHSENDRFIGPVSPYSSNVFTIGGVPMTSTDTQYGYYLDGTLQAFFYPGGIADYESISVRNAAGRITTLETHLNNILWSGKYTPDGQLSSATGNPYLSIYPVITNTYNKRLQPLTFSIATKTNVPIFSQTYDFHLGNGDNGNVYAITNNKDNNRSQNFTYDSLNRIGSAYTTGPNWGETFTIDAWGNLTNKAQYTGKTYYESLNGAPATTKNQLTGYTYDAAGNLTNDGLHSYQYDAENRLISLDSGAENYVYDGNGTRVKKCSGTPCSAGTFYWRNIVSGETIAESDLSGNMTAAYMSFEGRPFARIDEPSGNMRYYFGDRLNSVDVETDPSGTILSESDYYPYGGEIPLSGGDASNHYKFTGKERDSESNLDEFGARYYSSSIGRFTQPDWAAAPTAVPYAKFGNPQSLNLYSYVENNPTTLGDPDGHDIWDVIQGAGNAFGSDFFGGAGRQESDNGDYKTGQAIGDFGATVAGTGEALLGVGGEGTGLLLDSTGVGAPAGVALNVVSAGAIAQGATAAATGAVHLTSALNKGGGKNEQKVNPGRVQSAKDKLSDLKQQRDTLEHKTNKTPEQKAQIDKLKKAIKRQTDRLRKSETHSRKEKGQQQ